MTGRGNKDQDYNRYGTICHAQLGVVASD